MSSPRDSLRWRLPLALCVILAIGIGAFAATAYRRMQSLLIETRGAHAAVASSQVATLLAQSAQQSLTRYSAVAGHEAVGAFLANPVAENAGMVRRYLAGATPAEGPATLEVWSDDGVLLLSVAGKAGPAGSAGPAPAAAGLLPFQQEGGRLFNTVAVPIAQADARGFLVVRRPLGGGQTADALQRLVGGDAVIKVGTPGGVWTDLTSVVDPPALTQPGRTDERDSHAAGAVIATSRVASTPLLASVVLSLDGVLGPARRLLGALAIAALLIVAGAALVGYIVMGRITRPLASLSEAASSIAEGRLSQRVDVSRGDEIGRLAAAFNTMSARVEEMHDRLESRVEERTRELEAFSYSVSHDLRAPLRHIVGFAALLERTSGADLAEEGRRHLETIKEAAGKMGRLIDDLLAFSRTSRLSLNARRVDLGALVDGARRDAAIDAAGRTIEWQIGPLPDVWGDPDLLRLALLNVLSNAVKYTAPRDVARIEVSARRDAGGDVVLCVRDNGVGFDPAYAAKLFGVFQRLHRADEFEGTGIGLANVRQIVNRHGGRVWAESAVDAGAAFYLTLPAAPSASRSEAGSAGVLEIA